MSMNYIEPNLPPDEEPVVDQLLNIVVPSLHQLLFMGGHMNGNGANEFIRRAGSCCRQVAVMSAVFLDEEMPGKWEVWEGEFEGIFRGVTLQYDHAWVYSPDVKRFVDFAHRKDRRVWRVATENQYPTDLQPTWTAIRRSQIDWRNMFNHPEYYTGLLGHQIYDLIAKTWIRPDERWYEHIRPRDVD